jgi:hypothetical protein
VTAETVAVGEMAAAPRFGEALRVWLKIGLI